MSCWQMAQGIGAEAGSIGSRRSRARASREAGVGASRGTPMPTCAMKCSRLSSTSCLSTNSSLSSSPKTTTLSSLTSTSLMKKRDQFTIVSQSCKTHSRSSKPHADILIICPNNSCMHIQNKNCNSDQQIGASTTSADFFRVLGFRELMWFQGHRDWGDK